MFVMKNEGGKRDFFTIKKRNAQNMVNYPLNLHIFFEIRGRRHWIIKRLFLGQYSIE